MTKNDNFLSKIIQYIGTFFTIAGIISQYLFREEFRKILYISDTGSYYDAFTISGLISGLIIVIGLYANRYFLISRFYLNKRKYKKYLEGIKKVKSSTDSLLPESTKDVVLEPFYLNGKRLALISLISSIIFFIFIFYFKSPFLKSIFYLLFFLAIIFSVTIFLLLLFMEEDWKRKNDETREVIWWKIREYFTPKIKIIEKFEDTSSILYPVNRMIIEVEGRKYSVVTDKNNPEKYFLVEPYIEKREIEK